jgi:hypothetical protein
MTTAWQINYRKRFGDYDLEIACSKEMGPGLENRDYGRRRSAALTM